MFCLGFAFNTILISLYFYTYIFYCFYKNFIFKKIFINYNINIIRK
ncbi:hypothetical protein BGAPBR_K0038 (plasmid) [Borreliella garinii PBr]|uniref:Uncharacterized protein n=1 Tax=Borreliella garinii PBr TaxID=498743 RepID=B8F0S1_BORGR|nr:hypothetical protein BGAPBR_K0038 [Borreliella garinii PBr]